MDLLPESGGLNSYGEAGNGYAAIQDIVVWLNSVLVDIHLPLEATAEDIRACLLDGTVLCQILDQLHPGSLEMVDDDDYDYQSSNVERFLSAVHKMGFPGFDVLDLEQGYLEGVFECLLALRENLYVSVNDGETTTNHTRKKWNLVDVEYLDEECVQKDGQHLTKTGPEKRRSLLDSKFPTALRHNEGSALNEPNNKFNEVFYAKKGALSDISAAKILDMMKWNSLDKAPTQLLFCIVDKVLDESFEGKNGDVPRRVACLMRKLVREIERRVSSQADRLKNHNNTIKSREVKYQSRVKVLQTLAVGTAEENEVVINQLRQIRSEKAKLEDKKKHDDQDVVHLRKEIDQRDAEIIALKQGMEAAKLSYERQSLELENQMKETKFELKKKIQELEYLLADTNNKMKEIEEHSEMKILKLKKKESYYQSFMSSHFSMLQVLREDLHAVRSEVKKSQKRFPVEVLNLGTNLKGLVDAAESYHMVLDENRKLYNEVQDLKGNIRVYCRVRPFLSGQSVKQTSIEHIGENGELVVTNPTKQGKDTRRLFKFNKVFGQTVTQEEVFKDTQPLIRSVLDGYNVCIFAYGQTGSGKTYTMSGPDMSSQKDWGVNYRALHDLFQISQSRRTSIIYEVGVQMVEIYNEQVRDLLATDGPQKRLGIWSTSQPNGLAVPDATMHPVKSTSDVLELMNIGLMNRAVGATALNERSSRSHSILTVHVHGTDLKKNSVLRGSLHLVDLAGSERVDRSEATGDRLREAQHINKSLSALGDVIFALAHKSGHVPYRNSKLTQVLQSSLGGQAKTLMFVQLNPDPESYSETVSTLKFAERVSGVELGAARSNKEGRDVREFMEQITSLKETITKKDEELEQLRLVKTNDSNFQKRGISIARGETTLSHSPRRHSIGPASRPLTRTPSRARSATSDQESCSESGSQRSAEESRYQTGSFHPRIPAVGMMNSNTNNDDVELLGFGDDSEERLSDISDSGLSMGTETDGSMTSVVEYTLFPDTAAKPAAADNSEKSAVLPSKLPKPPSKQVATSAATETSSSQPSVTKSAPKVVSGMRRSSSTKVPAVSSSSMKPKLRSSKRWQ